jgi:DNA polymerase
MSGAQGPRGELANIIASARMHLEMEQSLGVERMPFDPSRRKKTTTRRASSGASGKAKALKELENELSDCCRCGLGKLRTNLVFGVGNPDADLMFIGEAPGRDEDEQGIPFVGRAGQLLTKIIESIGLMRDDVYIANICKCRPPENRMPTPEESALCFPYLRRQIEIIQPRIIVALGNVPMRMLLETTQGITKMRGHFADWNGIEVMPTFHPSYLLRNPPAKREVWEDMQTIWKRMKELGLKVGELKSTK